MHRPDKQIGWPTLAGLGLVVVAFMVLSLCVTATGTARFAVGMGYDANVGYAVGAIFDIAKGVLPMGLLALWSRRAFGTAAFLAIAWVCLVAYSCLATHATVSTAISAIERTGTWKMEVRGNAKAELASVEQQLAVLSRPAPPRPAKTVREALAGERVPPASGRTARSAPPSRKASTSPRHAPRSSSCAASWRRPGLRAAVRACWRAAQGPGSGSHHCHLGPASCGLQRHPGPRAANRGHGGRGAAAHNGRRDHQLLWPRGPKGARTIPGNSALPRGALPKAP